jgi:putative transposase
MAESPGQPWVAGLACIPAWSGWMYLAMDTNMRTELILDALQLAVTQRQPRGVIHHSSRGGQYTSYAFGKRCQRAEFLPPSAAGALSGKMSKAA